MANNNPALSAVICTHNRHKSVSATINSVLAQDIDRQDYEIIVVDNSADAEQARQFGAQYDAIENFRYVHEPIPGLSKARNVGAHLALAPIVAYLDDDAVAPPQWLRELSLGYQKFGDRAAIVGGPVEPVWVTPRPHWLTSDLEGFFSDRRSWQRDPLNSCRTNGLLAAIIRSGGTGFLPPAAFPRSLAARARFRYSRTKKRW